MIGLGWVVRTCLALLIVVACGPTESVDTLARARQQGVLRIGFANEPPFAFRDPKSGQVIGEAPAVARHVLGKLGIPTMEGVVTEFGALIPGLKAGRFDMIAAGMYVTPSRCEQVLFSEPSYCVHEALLVRAGNPKALHSYADLRARRAQVGVVAGTAELDYARTEGLAADQIRVFPDAAGAVDALRQSQIDAVAATQLTLRDIVQRAADPNLALAQPFADPKIDGVPQIGCGAFAFRMADRAFRDAFDAALIPWLGSDDHRQRVEVYGFDQATLPQGISRARLCGVANANP